MKQLTPKQNTACAILFLNTFGLLLEEKEEVTLSSHLKIFNQENIEVGCLYFEDNKIKILVTNPNLKASYDIPEVFSFIDFESESDALFALYGEWLSKISFELDKIKGEFLVNSLIDSEYGIKCQCHASIDFEDISFHILRNGCLFRMIKKREEEIEKIEVRPTDGSNGFFIHDKIVGKYDTINNYYPYRKYCGIFNGPEIGEYKGKLHVFKKEEEMGKRLDFFNDYVSEKEVSYQRRLIEKGSLMKELDPSFFEAIKKEVSNTPYLSSLISVCFNASSYELVNAILGIKKEDILFQNGSSNLEDAYFGSKTKEYMKNLLN